LHTARAPAPWQYDPGRPSRHEPGCTVARPLLGADPRAQRATRLIALGCPGPSYCEPIVRCTVRTTRTPRPGGAIGIRGRLSGAAGRRRSAHEVSRISRPSPPTPSALLGGAHHEPNCARRWPQPHPARMSSHRPQPCAARSLPARPQLPRQVYPGAQLPGADEAQHMRTLRYTNPEECTSGMQIMMRKLKTLSLTETDGPARTPASSHRPTCA